MSSRADDRILAGHGLLAGSIVFWRAVEGTPWLTSAEGRGLLGHPAGEALLAVWMLVAVGTLVALAILTLRGRRPVALVLGVLLAGALWSRQGVDAFDLAYLLAVAVAVALRVGGLQHGGRLEAR